MNLSSASLWLLRTLWVFLPVTLGTAIQQAVGTDPTTKLVGDIYFWIVWFVGLLASLVVLPTGLTILKTATPPALVTSILATFATGTTEATLSTVLCFTVFLLTFSAPIEDIMINGSAYASERRMSLKTPTVATFFFIPVLTMIQTISLISPVLLLRSGHPTIAFFVAIVTTPVLLLPIRTIHQFSKRWIVFVPAGLVLHDYLLLAEPILFKRNSITKLGAATMAGTNPDDLLDLSISSAGTALRIETKTTTKIPVQRKSQIVETEAAVLLFTPTLPGAVLKEARARAIHIAT